jgi:serine/threonine protein phosphatase 1
MQRHSRDYNGFFKPKEPILPSPRTIAIGDIHGCLAALDTLLAAIELCPDDTLVLLGDYIDRGPDTRGVIERLLGLRRHCQLVPLMGNHDEMMLQVLDGQTQLYVDWLLFGGNATLKSYGNPRLADIPADHVAFLRSCPLYYEMERYFFIHGNYIAELPLADQPRETLLWDSLKMRQPGPHCSGKMAILGHSSQKSGEILDLGYLKCIDTRCYDQGWLTALDVGSGKVWQADKKGERRGERGEGLGIRD